MSTSTERGMTDCLVNLFAGGGGASLGIERALSRQVDVAIDHDPITVAVHQLNNPSTRHIEADIWDVRPREATLGRPVSLLWASPDCTHFSAARGNRPRSRAVRSLAWAVVDWAREVRPGLILLENVREFRGWGPLGEDGRPIRTRKGDTFREWVAALEVLGYEVDWMILDASEYGAPTRRKRLFVVARCDGEAIRWPEPTHGAGRLPLEPAWTCIDWSLPCPSIFERRRPLAEKTMWRIAQGVKRYVLEAAEPFVLKVNHGGADARVASLEEPLSTVTAQRRGHALVVAFLAKHFGGVVGKPRREPTSTVTARDHHALCAAHLLKLRGQCHGADLREPLPTLTARGTHVAVVRAFLTAYYGPGVGQKLLEPMRTLAAKHRLGLVEVAGADFQIVDIGMRMLEPHELLRAQFGEHAERYSLEATKVLRGKERPLTKADKVRLIGNTVAPHVAAALVRANAPGMEAP